MKIYSFKNFFTKKRRRAKSRPILRSNIIPPYLNLSRKKLLRSSLFAKAFYKNFYGCFLFAFESEKRNLKSEKTATTPSEHIAKRKPI